MLPHNGNGDGQMHNVDAKAGQPQERPPLENDASLLVGYTRAVNAAALAFTILFGLKMFAEGASSSVPFPARVWSFAIPVLIMGGFFWIGAFIAALVPVFLAHAVARRFKLSSLIYYLASGALTGLVLTPAYVLIGPQQSWQSEQSFSEACIAWAPVFIACGACGAISFWRTIVRHTGVVRRLAP